MEDAAEQLDRLAQSVGECRRCEEIVARRLRAVPGGGHPHCAVMIVSLQPDPSDEADGKAAGSTIVEHLSEFMPALAEAGDKVYVTTLLKCVARNAAAARPPETVELDNCFPYLSRELSITTPHYILTIGEQATRYVLRRLFKDQAHHEGDSLELRVFDNPAFRIVPVAEPEELRARDARERKEYGDRLKTLGQVMGL
jgi:uracil-DNA glycosylase family 4